MEDGKGKEVLGGQDSPLPMDKLVSNFWQATDGDKDSPWTPSKTKARVTTNVDDSPLATLKDENAGESSEEVIDESSEEEFYVKGKAQQENAKKLLALQSKIDKLVEDRFGDEDLADLLQPLHDISHGRNNYYDSKVADGFNRVNLMYEALYEYLECPLNANLTKLIEASAFPKDNLKQPLDFQLLVFEMIFPKLQNEYAKRKDFLAQLQKTLKDVQLSGSKTDKETFVRFFENFVAFLLAPRKQFSEKDHQQFLGYLREIYQSNDVLWEPLVDVHLEMFRVEEEREKISKMIKDEDVKVKLGSGNTVDDFDDFEEIEDMSGDKDDEKDPLLGDDMQDIPLNSESEKENTTVLAKYDALLNGLFKDDDLFRRALIKMKKAYDGDQGKGKGKSKSKSKTSGQFIKEMNVLARAKQMSMDSAATVINGKTRAQVAQEFEQQRKDYNASADPLWQNVGMILGAIGLLAILAGFIVLGVVLGGAAGPFAAASTDLIISLFTGGGTFFGAGLTLTLWNRPDTAARCLNKISKVHDELQPQAVIVI